MNFVPFKFSPTPLSFLSFPMSYLCRTLFIFLTFPSLVFSQSISIDSLYGQLPTMAQDTHKVIALIQIANQFRFARPAEASVLLEEANELTIALGFKKGEAGALNLIGEIARTRGEYIQSLVMQFKALALSRSLHDQYLESTSLAYLGFTYAEMGEYQLGLKYSSEAYTLHGALDMVPHASFALSNIGHTYQRLGLLDSALYYQTKARTLLKQSHHIALKSLILNRMGLLKSLMGRHEEALSLGREALATSILNKEIVNRSGAYYRIADAYYELQQPDSSLTYARLALDNSQKLMQRSITLDLYNLLTRLFKQQNQLDSAFHYQQLSIAQTDSLFGPDKIRALQLLTHNEFLRQQQSEADRLRFKNQVKLWSLFATVLIFLSLGLFLYKNNLEKQKTNQVLEKTLLDLKTMQHQLIQSEKMASLGELTAGIAHEIQNPLNFVNNFSEVNKELIVEIKEELALGYKQLATGNAQLAINNWQRTSEIINDIESNSEKINHHGKRAESIVKGMLEHSRKSSGIKELTNINALCEEFVKLSYQAMRSRDQHFQCEIKFELDRDMPKINVVAQDMSRVILNVVNNAFQACSGESVLRKSVGMEYHPEVKITTKLSPPIANDSRHQNVMISISDNGPGIPDSILDKIFQPFFTTKPTGQGTGLGLSLAYDIVKAHGGEIKVETKEGEGSEFVIQLPI